MEQRGPLSRDVALVIYQQLFTHRQPVNHFRVEIRRSHDQLLLPLRVS
jgi:hypothetical protein